jgi:hypothetical protein
MDTVEITPAPATLRERLAAALAAANAAREQARRAQEAAEHERLAQEFNAGAVRLATLLAHYDIVPAAILPHPDREKVDDGAICTVEGITFEVQGRPEQRRGVELRLLRRCPVCDDWLRSVWNLRPGDLAQLAEWIEPTAACWPTHRDCVGEIPF